MHSDLDVESMLYGLRQAFADLRRLKKIHGPSTGLYRKQLESSITAQRQVVIGLFRAFNQRRRDERA